MQVNPWARKMTWISQIQQVRFLDQYTHLYTYNINQGVYHDMLGPYEGLKIQGGGEVNSAGIHKYTYLSK